MRRWNLLLMLVTLLPAVFATSSTEGEGPESDEDSEGDSAPFVVAIEHSNGWRCSGSLVSIRTVLTSAWCAVGPPAALLPAPTAPSTEAPLWAMAGSRPRGPNAIRRVTSISLAYEARAEEQGASIHRDRWSAWGGAENDVALLQLTAAFGPGANVQPILLAGAEQDCGAAICHSVHGADRGLLSIETLTRASAACAPLAPHWQTVRDKALCFKGPELCPNEWGSGVICGGKLCGVISRSAREDVHNDSSETISEKLVSGCGSVHAALSVPRWRRFFDCAHTLRECGKDKCSKVCTERVLEDTLLDQPRRDATTQVVEDQNLDERRLEDRQEERRIEESRQEDSGENAIVPAAARNEPASVHYESREQPGGGYGNAYRPPPDYTRYQPPRTGLPQDMRRPGPRSDDLRYDRPGDLNVRPEVQRPDYSIRPEYAPKQDYPAHNFNYPREDVVRGHEIRNWTSFEYDRTKAVNYDRDMSTGHVPNVRESPAVVRGMEYEDVGAPVPYGHVPPAQPVPSNMVGTSPPFTSSPPNVFPPPYAAPPTYAVPQIFNSPPPYAAVQGPPAISMGEVRGPPPPAEPLGLPPAPRMDYPATPPQLTPRQREFEPYRSDFKIVRHFSAPVTMASQPPVPPPFEPIDAAATRPTNNFATILLKSLFLIIYTLTL